MQMTPQMLVQAIAELPFNQDLSYISASTKGRLRLVRVDRPLGPIVFRRFNPSQGESFTAAKDETIGETMLRRVANAMAVGVPLNIDRILGASYNTRSVLEALLAHTPQFYVCRPGRIELCQSSSQIKRGHKHLLLKPDSPHPPGEITTIDSDMVISELPAVSAVYEALVLPELPAGAVCHDSDELRRRHAQIQVSLVTIAESLGMKAFVAKNDQGIMYRGKRLAEKAGVVPDLSRVPLLSPFPDAVKAGSLIDCILFRNGRFMPAVIEVEHSTGVTSGLTRMQGFREKAPPVQCRHLIAAPDEDREKVLKECARPQFKDLNAGYLPYSAIDELQSLVQRRKLKGTVTDQFLEAFIENAA